MNNQEKEFRNLLDKYVRGSISAEEKKILDRFFEDSTRESTNEDVDASRYLLLERRLKQNIDRRVSPATGWKYALRIAASISLVVAVAYVAFNFNKEEPIVSEKATAAVVKQTDRGQKVTIKLSDGTTVKLNSNSRLLFPEKFGNDYRVVTLEGEGYFEVAHNPSVPFIVNTASSSTRVLGTSFNVSEKSGKATEVTLVSGKVRISLEGDSEAINLKPNQQAVILNGGNRIDTTSVDVSRFIEWKDNILTFEDTPIEEVASRLEDWYGVDITIKSKAIQGCKITARYESESLENVLKSFRFMLKGTYTLDGKKVTLTGKGCKQNQ